MLGELNVSVDGERAWLLVMPEPPFSELSDPYRRAEMWSISSVSRRGLSSGRRRMRGNVSVPGSRGGRMGRSDLAIHGGRCQAPSECRLGG